MSYEVPFAYASSGPDVEDRRPWLEDRRERERMLGVSPPRAIIPTFPDVLVVPGYRHSCALPTHFRAYAWVGMDVIADAGPTFEQARYNLHQTVEARS